MEKFFTYTSSLTKKELLQKIETERAKFYAEHCKELYLTVSENDFQLGLERARHSGGYWYIPKMSEQNGKLTISGKIEYVDGSQEDNQEIKTGILLKILNILSFIIFAIPILAVMLVVYTVSFLIKLFELIFKKNNMFISKDKILNIFMTKYLGCKEVL